MLVEGRTKTGGRVAGTPNKATKEFRATVQALLDANAQNVSKWLAAVAADDPGKALDLLAKLAEFAAPKLARTEHTGKDGSDLMPPALQIVIASSAAKDADAPQ